MLVSWAQVVPEVIGGGPLRLGFRGFHYVFERQKEGRYMDHTFTCRCMLHVI